MPDIHQSNERNQTDLPSQHQPHVSPYYHKTNHKMRNRAIAGTSLILILVAAAGGFWFIHSGSHKKVAKKPATAQVAPSKQTTSATTTHFVSTQTALSLEFDYPSNWTLSPTQNASSTQPITITTPLVTIPSASGSNVTGQVIVSLQPGGTSLAQLSSGTAVAAQDSTQFAYKQPTAAQHQYPFLSFVNIPANSGVAGSFSGVVVTGIQPFPKTTPITNDSIGQIDPLISARFYSCLTTACTGSGGAKDLNITNATWQNSKVFQQVLAVFESLKLN